MLETVRTVLVENDKLNGEAMMTKEAAARFLGRSIRHVERLRLPSQLVMQPKPKGGSTRVAVYRRADIEASRDRKTTGQAVAVRRNEPAPEPALWLPLPEFARLVGLSEALLVRWAIPEQVRACYDAGLLKCRRADAARVDPWAWEGFDPTTGEAL